MPAEIELKLALPASAVTRLTRHPLLRQAEALPSHLLLNHYFDTPELDLTAARVAVRTRKQGRQWLQTVKCSGTVVAGLSHRPEWEQPYRQDRFDFSAIDAPALKDLLESPSISQRLAPVFSTHFRRRTWRLCPSTGVEILVMLDRGEVLAGEKRLPICELELELVAGEAHALFNLAQHLATSVPLRLDNVSKAARGYRLLGSRPLRPAHAARAALAPDLTPLQAFCRAGHAGLAHLQANEDGLLGENDPEFIHQARVALRRLRATLNFFAPVLPPGTREIWLKRLGNLARGLEEARGLDVLAGLLPPPAAGPHPAQDLAATALAQREAARLQASQLVSHGSWGLTLLDFSALLHQLSASPATQGTLAEFAHLRLRAAWNRVERRARRARHGSFPARHALRIAVKQLRYSLETCTPLLAPQTAGPALQQLARVQEILGRQQDLASLTPRLLRMADDNASLREVTTRRLGELARAARSEEPALANALKALSSTRKTLNIKVAMPQALAI